MGMDQKLQGDEHRQLWQLWSFTPRHLEDMIPSLHSFLQQVLQGMILLFNLPWADHSRKNLLFTSKLFGFRVTLKIWYYNVL